MSKIPLIVDIETSSSDPAKPDWALDFNRNIIDLIGTLGPNGQIIYEAQQLEEAKTALIGQELCGHNLKFDYKTLHAKGFQLTLDQYSHDTLVMATASIKKIPEAYLEQYNEKRRELNKSLPKGKGHREAGKHSLKTLAPYFLQVSPFWENPENHNDKGYLALDLSHTKSLFLFFEEELKRQGTYNFYVEKLMPWARMTLQAELEGIKIDLVELDRLQAMAEAGVISSLKKLRQQWTRVEEEYYYKQVEELKRNYAEKKEKAIIKAKDKTKCESRYSKLLETAITKIEPFNYSSPTQILWALKDCLGYNVVDAEGEEGTGSQVLQILSNQGKEDIKALLEYRENYKLAHSYFPSYKELVYDGRIHCNFNIFGAWATGRLSSSNPNLQQVPPVLKKVFVAGAGNVLISRDINSVEPCLIAFYSEDEELCRIIINKEDFHSICAIDFFEPEGILPKGITAKEVKEKYNDTIRYAAKQGDLSGFYGSGKNRLHTTFTLNGIKVTLEQCSRMIRRFRQRFQGVFEFKEMLDAELGAGNSVDNIVGRKVYIADPQDVYMRGFNSLIQSSGSDILLTGVYDFLKEMNSTGYKVGLRLLVHDNAVIEAFEKDAEYVMARLDYHMTKFKLPTKHGNIQLKTEGGYNKAWIK